MLALLTKAKLTHLLRQDTIADPCASRLTTADGCPAEKRQACQNSSLRRLACLCDEGYDYNRDHGDYHAPIAVTR